MKIWLFLTLIIPVWALGTSSYFNQSCPIGNNEKLIVKEDTVFYFQVENEAKLEQILVMVFQLDVIKDDRAINQIRLLNGYEVRPYRRGELILMPHNFILSEYNKRVFVLSNCEVVPLLDDGDEETL